MTVFQRQFVQCGGFFRVWLGCAIICGLANHVKSVNAHEFDDGFVERSVAIVVQDDQLLVDYSVGLNANTMRQLLNQWEANSVAGRDQAVDSSTDSSETAWSSLSDERVETEFRSRLGSHIKNKFLAEVDGEAVELAIEGAEISSRHHVNMTVRLTGQLTAGLRRMDVIDSNFIQLDGGVRYALKVRGSSNLQFSNVEPSLIRAERVELGKIKKELRDQHTRVIAKVHVQSPNDRVP